jgi:hypothetical protein
MQFLVDLVLIIIYICVFLFFVGWIWRTWMFYINQRFLDSLQWAMLEIRLPREIDKSPVAMEMALHSILQAGGVGNWRKKYVDGALPTYSSLEIASDEGIVRFYLRVQKKLRPLMEESLYAHYPGIEIVEAPDYTSKIRYTHLSKDVSIWGARYKLNKTWAYPIKTYVDFKLDEGQKEEQKVDPITTLLEFMGSVTKGEHVWFQIVLSDESNFDGKKFPKLVDPDKDRKFGPVNIYDAVEKEKARIRTKAIRKKGEEVIDQYGNVIKRNVGEEEKSLTYGDDIVEQKKEMELTVEEKFMIESANKKISKPGVAAVIRLLYVTKKENFNPAHINEVISVLKPYKGMNEFGFSPTDPYDFPWETQGGMRPKWRGEELFDAYVEREGVAPLFHESDSMSSKLDRFFANDTMKARKTFNMFWNIFFHPFHRAEPTELSLYNLEEIATLWHFPGMVATTPTLPRIDSTKGMAPVNLPQ